MWSLLLVLFHLQAECHHFNICTVSWLNGGEKFTFCLFHLKCLSCPCRNWRSLAVWRTSRSSSLTGRWAMTQFCIWQQLKDLQLVRSTSHWSNFVSPVSVFCSLILFQSRSWLDWSDSLCRSDEASSGHTPHPPPQEPQLKVKSNFQSCLDLLLYYGSIQVEGKW